MIGKLNASQIDELLKKHFVGRIGCQDGDEVFIVPVSYAYDGKYIYVRSFEGKKIDMMRNNPNVCFEVDEVKDFINWRSVILWGVYQELFDERSRYDVMKSFNEKMLHIKIKASAHTQEALQSNIDNAHYSSTKAVIYRIIINERSGRFEKK